MNATSLDPGCVFNNGLLHILEQYYLPKCSRTLL